ncbi:acyl-CoA dehydrogenase family protein [Rhodococcus sp. T7]|uniref:acyl-CoA dehydrogenase family protein n=1 Tax=Rhodococcus sp. T7 TaxID=627444 RepID=UPI0013591D1D|nr:acyl-CoA dehydrogenase family protein [Rhodococcus sp. T7]KAF0957997.1 putative acyl-CoA dehydrogenase FadE17 [Rhodococcus sp. T7]KAF0960156.1 putative acyl-CoA dehydrogenase FadE17 [Rhodococcus sp. T7]
MDFTFTGEQEQFRQELRDFLAEHENPEWRGLFGSNSEEIIPFTREICQALAKRGWLTLSWPAEYGGSDGDLWSQMVLREEMWAAGEPRGPQYMNLNYIGPMIMKFGTEEQKQRFLPPMARGEVIWTQGFSEPGAGSDLASLTTRAEDRGDHFVVNGQKIWNSYASSPADWCMLLARTDSSGPKQAGISVLLVDMTTPGVVVRPIRSMAGMGEINEIFFEDVIVPRDSLLGSQDDGWPLINYGLSFERTGIAMHSRAARTIDRVIQHARSTVLDGRPLSDDPAVRARLADVYCRYRAARLISYRITSMVEAGEDPVAEASMAWIHGAQLTQDAAAAGLDVLAAAGQLLEEEEEAPMNGAIEREWVEMLAMTIAGGTSDIQRAIVSQRGLGLPRAR